MRWEQVGRTLWLHTDVGSRHAIMPYGWDLEAVHPTVLAVVEWMLAVNLPIPTRTIPEVCALPARKPGKGRALCFSGGADSVSALKLMDGLDVTPVYLRRGYNTYQRVDGVPVSLGMSTALDALMEKHRALVVSNDLEQLGLDAGLRHGFHHGYGYAVIPLLLADFLDLGEISFGGILDTVWFGTGLNADAAGSTFCDIWTRPSGIYKTTAKVLAQAGIFVALPVAGCSEVITTRIAERYGAISCPCAYGSGVPCGTCFKCFRKQQILGVVADAECKRVAHVLEHRPLKMATSTLRGCEIVGRYPESLREFAGLDLSWTERHYDASLDALCSPEAAQVVRTNLAAHGIEPMTEADVAAMKAFMRETP